MTIQILRNILRFLIVALVTLPLVLPYIEKSIERQPPKTINVWLDVDLSWGDLNQARTETLLRRKLAVDPSVKFNYRKFGSMNQPPVQDYEELITQLN